MINNINSVEINKKKQNMNKCNVNVIEWQCTGSDMRNPDFHPSFAVTDKNRTL